MLTVFWSPKEGSGSTSNIALTGIMLAWQLRKKVIILNTSYKNHDLEKYLVSFTAKNLNILDNIGIDVLFRSVILRDLNKETLSNAAMCFYDDNLQVVSGTIKVNESEYQHDMEKKLPAILEEAKKDYDYVLVDAPSGYSGIGEQLKSCADKVVINLPQDKHVIDEYFKRYYLKEKDVLYLIGMYDGESRYNLKNLEKLFKPLKSKIAAIPYNTDLKDAISESAIIKYLQKNIDVEGENLNLIQELLKVSNRIIKKEGKIEDESGVDS